MTRARRPTYWIFKKDRVLCYDGRLRSFSGFGSYSYCFKPYCAKGWALRKAQDMRAAVIAMPPDVVIDAALSLYAVDTETDAHSPLTGSSISDFIIADFRRDGSKLQQETLVNA